MKITLHCYIINYYLTQWTDNRMPDKRGTDNRGSTVLKTLNASKQRQLCIQTLYATSLTVKKRVWVNLRVRIWAELGQNE